MDGAAVRAAILVRDRVGNPVLADSGLGTVDHRTIIVERDTRTLGGVIRDIRHLEVAVSAPVVLQQVSRIEVVRLAAGDLVVVIDSHDGSVAAGGWCRRDGGAGTIRPRGRSAIANLHMDETGVGAAILVDQRVLDRILALPTLQGRVDGSAVAVERHGRTRGTLTRHG